MIQMHRQICDTATNLDLYISWLDFRIPYDTLSSWLGIVLFGFMAYLIVKALKRGGIM